MRSEIFYTDQYLRVQDDIKQFLNAQEEFLSSATAGSPRAVGDAIQEVLGKGFAQILGDACAECSADFARRAMADIAFTDRAGIYYVVDVKTHRTDTKFNMPNLTSVERLSRFYESPSNYFVVLLVSYTMQGNRAIASAVRFVPIEFLGWDCLTIGALGWGQIQIANSNYITLRPQYSRRSWMLELCDAVLEFYPREIAKIGTRMAHFEEVRRSWQQRPDLWQARPVEAPKAVDASGGETAGA